MLNRILEETGDYCERVKNMALFYVCKEKVVAVKYYYPRRDLEKFSLTAGKLKARDSRQKTFTYDYQLVKKEKELREKRILLEEDGKEKHEEDVELRPVKYIGKYLVYGPVGFLSKYWQKRFDYEIVGEDVLDGKETIIIASSPKKEREENDNYGRVWVDKKNFSIMKIEYDPRSIKDYEDELILSPIGDLKKKVVWTVSFGVEKKGVKFPSKQLVQEYYVNNEGKTVLVEEVTFHYVDYKFFIVEVEVKY
ncbi:MAG: outer membrane lipoprotein-sorting protein [Candidatus Aminicenantes bacterium]|nr:outer membrane lipoprotein-sorting protein [Candidatus Aminicenantes bacterium]